MCIATFKKYLLSALIGAVVAGTVVFWLYRPEAPKQREIPSQRISTSTQQPSAAVAESFHAKSDRTAGKAESIDVLVEGLRQRLEKQPNDVNGWVLLARSYHYLQRWDESEAAFAKAKSLGYREEVDAASSNAASADADPVFADVAEVVRRQSAQLQAPVNTSDAKSSREAH